MSQSLDIPIDVPWSLVAASPDMMDTTFCDGGFPPTWQSSLAIYAYEPSPNDLPRQLCNQRITYLKVTSSITGFQPSKPEVDDLKKIPTPVLPGQQDNVPVPLPTVPADVVEDLVSDYYACYGVLLNVAVFPSTTTVPQDPPVPQDDSFAEAADPLPNPFTDAYGLTFSLAGGKPLRTGLIPPNGPRALSIPTGRLQIDMPVSTNVVLKVSVRNRVAKATITAYQQGTLVFTGSMPNAAPGIQDVLIAKGGPVTQIVIEQTAEECSLAAVTFDGGERAVTLSDYPHIIDFEPKTRDLYQAATDQAELLTASNSGINTGKSLSNTSSSEMGLGVSASESASIAGLSSGYSGSLTGKWGNTSSDGSSTQIDRSREMRETQGTTTNITQQYNLLTGYHAGTNRAAFLMLPRPHTLQATDYRTFVRGLRMIEGIQEFFLIVSRPTSLPGLCIETSLETGHFPESALLVPPALAPPLTKTFVKEFDLGGPGGGISGIQYWYEEPGRGNYPSDIPLSAQFVLDPGWTLDRSKGSWQPGVDMTFSQIGTSGADMLAFIQAIGDPNTFKHMLMSSDDNQITIQTTCRSGGPTANQAAWVHFSFTIHAVQAAPAPADAVPQVVSPFLVTSRDLCVCIKSSPETNCVVIAPPPPPASGGRAPAKPGQEAVNSRSSIVSETKLKVPGHLLHSTQLQKSRTPAARELMYQIHHHMLASGQLPQRRPHATVGFADSDYVCEYLARHLPKAYLAHSIADVKGLPKGVVEALGADTTVGDVLKLELHRLRPRAKVELDDAIRIRRKLLGFVEEYPGASKL